MARLIISSGCPTNCDDHTRYRYIDEEWEVMACFMDDLPMYPTEETAREAYRAKTGRDPKGGDPS